jgi:hypothetical protein
MFSEYRNLPEGYGPPPEIPSPRRQPREERLGAPSTTIRERACRWLQSTLISGQPDLVDFRLGGATHKEAQR